MSGVVVFDASTFKVRYPEFATVSDGLLQGYFNTATLYLNNTVGSPVYEVTEREQLLWMLTAHIATLSGKGSGPSGIVGRIDQATEGSVTAHASYSTTTTPTMAWYVQTQYGASYWAATTVYRTMQYVPGQLPAPAGPEYSLPRFWGAGYPRYFR